MSASPGASSRWRLALVVVAIFTAGLVTGLAVPPLLFRPMHRPHGPPPWLAELELSASQRASAESIFERHRADVDVIMREAFPRIRARNEQMEQELKAVLSQEQAQRLEEIRKRRPPPPPQPGQGPMLDGPPPPPHDG